MEKQGYLAKFTEDHVPEDLFQDLVLENTIFKMSKRECLQTRLVSTFTRKALPQSSVMESLKDELDFDKMDMEPFQESHPLEAGEGKSEKLLGNIKPKDDEVSFQNIFISTKKRSLSKQF